MNRIETFVAAAFAFLLTMVMVAGNDIPQDIAGFKMAVLNIPAFCVSALQIIWIWYEHAVWSRRFGLEDAKTIVLSGLLIVIVMVFVYPLKAMAAGFFHWLSDGFFPTNIIIETIDDVRFLFLLFSIGFLLMSLTLWMMNRLVLAKSEELLLTPWEYYQTVTECYGWLIMILTSLASIGLTLTLNASALSLSGLIYSSLGVSMTILHFRRAKAAPKK
jgi:hypothetical protein